MREEYGRRRKPGSFPDYAHHGRDRRGGSMYGARVRELSNLPPPPDKKPLEALVLDEEEDSDYGEEDVLDFGDLKKFIWGESPESGEDAEGSGGPGDKGPGEGPFFLKPFRPRVRSLFVMQVVSTLALLTIYVLNFYLNKEFFATLEEITRPIYVIGNPLLLVSLGAMGGVGLVMYSYMRAKAKKWTAIVILSVTGLAFIGPLVFVLIGSGWVGALMQVWVEFQFIIKLIILFLVMSPVILGILGVWLESRLSLFVSTILLLSIVVILDVFLVIFNRVPEKELWSIPLIVFACGLFIFFEFGDSAIRFHKLYTDSVNHDELTVQSRHVVRMCKRYLVLSCVFLVVSMFLVLGIYNSNTILLGLVDLLDGMPVLGGLFQEITYLEKTTNSLVMDTVYGSLISMTLVIFLMVLGGTVVRNWYDISSWGKGRYRAMNDAMATMREREADEDDMQEIIVRRQEAKRRRRKGESRRRPAPGGNGRRRRGSGRKRRGGGSKKGGRRKPVRKKTGPLYKVQSVKVKKGRVKPGKKKKRSGVNKSGKKKRK